jgi:hypothetical protein
MSWLQKVMPESRLLQELCHLQVLHVIIKSSVIVTWTRRNPFITASGCGAKQTSPQSITQDCRARVNERMVNISRCRPEFHTDFPRWPLPIAGAADSIVLSYCKCTVVGTMEDHSTYTPTQLDQSASENMSPDVVRSELVAGASPIVCIGQEGRAYNEQSAASEMGPGKECRFGQNAE